MVEKSAFPNDEFVYKYLAGPVVTVEELKHGVAEGNCRFALQLYFYRIHNIFFERDEIYLPGGYKKLGEFVYKETDIDFNELEEGDVIFAQNRKNKKGEILNMGIENYETKDKWLYYLHSAIYLGKIDKNSDEQYVWHATNIEGGPVLWSLDKFKEYYIPISAKRVIKSF